MLVILVSFEVNNNLKIVNGMCGWCFRIMLKNVVDCRFFSDWLCNLLMVFEVVMVKLISFWDVNCVNCLIYGIWNKKN